MHCNHIADLNPNRKHNLDQGSANFLSRGPKGEMISLGGPRLLSEKKRCEFQHCFYYTRAKTI